jgi:hypothetical protein
VLLLKLIALLQKEPLHLSLLLLLRRELLLLVQQTLLTGLFFPKTLLQELLLQELLLLLLLLLLVKEPFLLLQQVLLLLALLFPLSLAFSFSFLLCIRKHLCLDLLQCSSTGVRPDSSAMADNGG